MSFESFSNSTQAKEEGSKTEVELGHKIEDTNYKATVELVGRLNRPANKAFAQIPVGSTDLNSKLANIEIALVNKKMGNYFHIPEIYFKTTKDSTDEDGRFNAGESFSFSPRTGERTSNSSYVLRGLVMVLNENGGPVAPDRKADEKEKTACVEIQLDTNTGELKSIKEITPDSIGIEATF